MWLPIQNTNNEWKYILVQWNASECYARTSHVRVTSSPIHTSLYASVYAKKMQVMSGTDSVVRHQKALHNNFIPCHRKYIALHNQYGARWKGSVEYWPICHGFPAFWLDVFSMTWYKQRYYTPKHLNKRLVIQLNFIRSKKAMRKSETEWKKKRRGFLLYK